MKTGETLVLPEKDGHSNGAGEFETRPYERQEKKRLSEPVLDRPVVEGRGDDDEGRHVHQ